MVIDYKKKYLKYKLKYTQAKKLYGEACLPDDKSCAATQPRLMSFTRNGRLTRLTDPSPHRKVQRG